VLQDTFERLTPPAGAEYQHFAFSLAGRTIQFHVIGRALAAQIIRPFRHLSVSDRTNEQPALAVHIWDEDTSEAPLPAVWRDDRDPRGRITSSADGNFVAYARPAGLSVLDRRGGRVVGCVRPGSRPLSERARPFTFPFTVWGGDHQIHIVHGGLVSDGRGVLFAGLSGSGKSTAALACSSAGYDFLADDAVALDSGPDGQFLGHSVYGSLTLDADGLARFPWLEAIAVGPQHAGEDKRIVFLDGCPWARLGRSAALRAVVLVRIGRGSKSMIRPATKREALLGLAPSSLVKRVVSPRDCLRQMARLVECVPSYWLDLGSDSRTIPERVAHVVSEIGA
jgi:hypothetical protein